MIPALRKQRQENHHKFKASSVYHVSSRSDRDIARSSLIEKGLERWLGD